MSPRIGTHRDAVGGASIVHTQGYGMTDSVMFRGPWCESCRYFLRGTEEVAYDRWENGIWLLPALPTCGVNES